MCWYCLLMTQTKDENGLFVPDNTPCLRELSCFTLLHSEIRTLLLNLVVINFPCLRSQNNFFFMDSETFEEMVVPKSVVGDREDWITEGSEVSLVIFKDKCIEVVTPSSVVFEIVDTEPNVKGNTAQGYTKPATLACGATINVPGYLETGDMVKVDTDKGAFLERSSA